MGQPRGSWSTNCQADGCSWHVPEEDGKSDRVTTYLVDDDDDDFDVDDDVAEA
jgi:hypothetical protein